MTIHELCVALQSLEPEDDVFEVWQRFAGKWATCGRTC
jgi:hypothetical protein